MSQPAEKKIKRLSLKILLLVCIFPVFVCAGLAGILFNYFMACDNVQQRMNDHILRRRMDLKYIAMLPTLGQYLANVHSSRKEKSGDLHKQIATYIAEYLKSLSPSFPHTLRIITLDGETLLRVESGELKPGDTEKALLTHIKALALLNPDQQPDIPTYAFPPESEKLINDLMPLYGEDDKRLIGAILYAYGFPVEELMASVKETLAFNIFLAVTTLVVALVVTYLILELNINPLRQLTALVQKMTGGDLSQAVDVKGRGEIRILATSFETLRRRLKQQIELLKTNADELTQSLADAHRTKAQLEQERDYSTSIVNETPNFVCGIDATGSITFMNPAAELLTGYTSRELLGQNFVSRLFPTAKEHFVEDLLRGSAQKAYYNREHTLTTRSGDQRTLLWNSLQRRNEAGQIKEIILIGNDISEIKDAENELRKFRTISDRSSYGSVIYDTQGNLTYINESYAVMHGYQPEELVGKHLTVFFGARYAKQQEQLQKQLMRTGYLTAEEVTHIRKDGREIPLLISSTMVRNDHGQPFFFSETAIDISEKKTLEEQLQIRQRMDSLGTLAAGIAHDFNNLLSGITGYLDLLHLRSDNFTGKQKRYLTQLTASVQRAAELVHQFQKLSHGNVSKKRYLDISSIVGEVFGFLQKTTDRLIQKQNQIESGRFYIKGNQTELSQVFLNLGVNAKEAIEAKGAARGDYIRAEARNVIISETKDKAMKGGRYVHLTFQDSGCGMSESIKLKAFDPLFSSKKLGQRKGQGLGLAMVYNIIKNHNGHITVDSTPGEGTVFHVYLPAAAPMDLDLDDMSGLMPGNETILLIDDEHMLRSVIKEELEQLGYSVIAAADGKEALDIYQSRKNEIALVLMDLILQKLPGDMLIKKMVASNPKVNIVIASAQSENQVPPETLTLVKGFLAKPLQISELSATLRRVINSN